MSGGKNPLMLMMALSMPGAAHALGLGDIHVDSALNERLSAHIDIVGATALELNELRAAVANRETFLRHGDERPAFLASTTFQVTQDANGSPVLSVRSTESFTEPVVNLLVELRWRTGELVREYTLLLDPAGSSPIPAAPSAPAAAPAAATLPAAAPAPIAPPAAPTLAAAPVLAASPSPTVSEPASAEQPRKTTHIKVGAKATLRGIAWRVGERSESDLQKMMLAIFRANPAAFDGNINRLHRGAVLTIPSRAEAAAISNGEAKREIGAQMAAWRSGAAARAASNAKPAATSVVQVSPAPAATAPADMTPAATVLPAASSAPTDALAQPETDALKQRVQSLEQELQNLKGLMESERAQLTGLEAQAARMQKTASPAKPAPAVVPVSAPVPASAVIASPVPTHHSAARATILVGLGTFAAALAALYIRFRRRPTPSPAPRIETEQVPHDVPMEQAVFAEAATPDAVADAAEAPAPVPVSVPVAVAVADPAPAPAQEHAEPVASASDFTVISAGPPVGIDATHPLLPAMAAAIAAGRSDAYDPTVNMQADPLRIDFNVTDLDLTAQHLTAQHVQMPSVLNEHAVVKERRTNLADVLKLAIEREPDRHDLRLKLLELYYAAADTNRKAFLDVVQVLARDRDLLNPDQWDKIADMGRKIASEDPLFNEESAAGDNLADCA